MKKNLALSLRAVCSIVLIAMLCNYTVHCQVVDIVGNPGNSGNTAFGAQPYAANENIYTESEIGAANFTTAATSINLVAFNIGAVGINTTFTNVTIWMKEVPLATTTFSSGTYATLGYTMVFSGNVSAPSIGWVSIPLTTSFQRSSGNNLQILLERNDGVAHTSYVYRYAGGNNTSNLANSSRRYNSTVPPVAGTTSLAAAVFRAQIRLQHIYPNDAQVQEVYTLGKLPIPFSIPHTIRTNIANVGANALSNIPVVLNITGANTFSNVQTIPLLAAGANVDVTFTAFTPVAQGNNNIEISLGADDFMGNNIKSVTQAVNNNTFSYAYGKVTDGSVGAGFVLAPFTGDFVARYNTSVNTAISQVSVYFVAGGQPFQIGIWDATGPGATPGNLLFTSATQTSATGIYVLPILPAIPITTGDFFVGVRQVDVTNIRFAYQLEDPIRTNTFYLTQPTGGTVWTDLSPLYKNRFIIEPKLQIPIDANLTSVITPSAPCNTGAVSYAVVLSNVGLTAINAGAANVTLKIGGANVYSATLSNTTNITAGTSETINFNGIPLNNPGINIDTALVTLPGDTEQLNDTLITTNNSTPAMVITAFPAVENVEATLPLFPNRVSIAGSSQLWLIHSGNYSNAGQPNPLPPHTGSKFFLFDSYGGPTSAGFVSRLYSNCITLPASSATNCNYSLQFYMSHDTVSVRSQLDSLYVTVSSNNGATWTRLLPGFRRFNVAYNIPGWEKLVKDLSAYAGQTIQIGFEGVSKHGNSFGLDDITIASRPVLGLILSPVTNNGMALTTKCDDQGWTYYSNPANPNAGLFAINWDPTNAGENVAAKATTLLTIQADPTFYAAEDIPAKKATYTMQRYWNLDAGASTLTSPVNIRFFYDATEKTAVDNAAATFATTNAGTIETATWFKTTTTGFTADAAHATPDGVANAIPLSNANVANNLINGLLYAQFDGITSFSGGTYATGVGPSSPLPVTLFGFDVKRSGKINQLNWSTAEELNTSRFVIEHSTDGRNFASIGEVAAAGRSTAIRNYNFSDNTPFHGINYYRLQVVDLDNVGKLSAVRSVRNAGSADVAVYPNPAKATIHIKINADNADRGEAVITDLSGKIVATKTLVIAQGVNLVPVSIDKLSAGAYIIKITLADDVVIRKFNKQ